ncbi:SapC family protein [Pseudoalteromonas sp. SG44-5]|uniref:SapC family protein n=1 Tax=Pseudoalteromonas sp. SG44-5 TaxID=2760960 RepID=UPI0015FBB0F9|nr:SapC family protein [Pseudoalteromonas sp. SG44-5]MBB1405197.1 SapC family protein [Pseudoalteromonas sp. SG44-5]
MHQLETVNSEHHSNTKVSLAGTLEQHGQVHMSHIVAQEFAEVAQYYPIFFAKDSDTGQFQPVALFGLAVDENIYHDSGLWEKCYLPLKLQSTPFYLSQDLDTQRPILAIDSNDARVNEQQGEALFNNGKASPYLQQQSVILSELTQGFVLNSAFINELRAYNLLESVSLDIKYNNGQAQQLTGLYTINKEMLEKVPSEVQTQFQQQGYTALLSAAMASVSHVSTLIDIKNRLLASKSQAQ